MQVNSSFNVEALQAEVVIRVSNLTKCWDETCILDDVNFTISSDARILLFGPNGTGKTTLLKILLGVEQPDRGEIRIVDSARIGYLPQDPQMDLDKTVLETYRYGQVGYEGEFVGRLIGYGLFRLEDMQKKVGQLSIGQRRKLEIARLMAEGPNVLLLDEPTNYISLDVLEAFEAAIVTFPGPVIAVSHDRWFMQRFGGKIWELVDGNIIS
jgi:macrolide transport system ATP-binding/permease protein